MERGEERIFRCAVCGGAIRIVRDAAGGKTRTQSECRCGPSD